MRYLRTIVYSTVFGVLVFFIFLNMTTVADEIELKTLPAQALEQSNILEKAKEEPGKERQAESLVKELSKNIQQKIKEAENIISVEQKIQDDADIIVEAVIYPIKKEAFNEIDIESNSSFAMDLNSENILYSENADKIVSIASITKLMTALVFLDLNPGWDAIYQIQEEDRREGGKIYLFTGDRVKIKDLFYTSLVGSANTATAALINSTGISEEEFVKKMNDKAKELGLINTVFLDATGLSANRSTAQEVAFLAKAALSNADIRQATLTANYDFKTIQGKQKIIYTTDYLLDNLPPNGISIIGGKTGYTSFAGYCFVGEFTNGDGREIVSVVLGSECNDCRFQETKNLVEWVYDSYTWGK